MRQDSVFRLEMTTKIGHTISTKSEEADRMETL